MAGDNEEGGEGRRRRYSGKTATIVKAISIFMPLYCIFYILNIAGTYLRILFYPPSFRALFLFFALTLIFLTFPATKRSPKDRLPWYDLLLIVIALAPTFYIFFITPDIVKGFKTGATVLEQVLFIIILLLLAEAIRRTVGLPVMFIVAVSIAYTKLAYLLPGLWGAPSFSLERLAEFLYLFDSGIFGMILGIPATVIITFVTFGSFLLQAGTAEFLMDTSLAVAGGVRGGPAKVALISSAAFGTMSGSATANVGTTGAITIPLMKKLGYRDYFAGAVETVASTGGVITPPVMGSIAFIMAEVTGLGYAAICVAAILPALLYYTSLYFQLDFEAAKLGLSGLPRTELPSAQEAVTKGWHLLLPILLLMVLLTVFRVNALEAVLCSIGATVVVSWLRKRTRMNLGKILDALAGGGQGVLYVVPVCAAAGVIMGAVSLTGLGVNLSALIRDAAGGNVWLLAIFTWMAIYVSGMAIGEIILYIVMAIVIVPAFIDMGVPMLSAHMFIFYMCISMFITPPNCPAVFVACSIAESGLWKTGFAAMKLGIVVFLVPFVILLNPAIMLRGSPGEVILALITSIAGALFLAAGIEGYLFSRANWWQRILFLSGGLGLFIPGWKTDLIGLGLLVVPVFVQWRAWQAKKSGFRAAGA